MNRLAKHELHLGSFLTIDEMLAAIDGVRHEEVQALITELLDEDRLALTTLGPLDRRNLPARARCATDPRRRRARTRRLARPRLSGGVATRDPSCPASPPVGFALRWGR